MATTCHILANTPDDIKCHISAISEDIWTNLTMYLYGCDVLSNGCMTLALQGQGHSIRITECAKMACFGEITGPLIANSSSLSWSLLYKCLSLSLSFLTFLVKSLSWSCSLFYKSLSWSWSLWPKSLLTSLMLCTFQKYDKFSFSSLTNIQCLHLCRFLWSLGFSVALLTRCLFHRDTGLWIR